MLPWIFFLIIFMPPSLTSGYLQGGDVKCDDEGQLKLVPGITSNPCITCTCIKGIVRCENRQKQCPNLYGCYNKVPTDDQCCKYKCMDCGLESGNKTSSIDHVWINKDQCTLNRCFSGVLTSGPISCPSKPNCKNPILPTTTYNCNTCASCPGCTKNGLQFQEGETKLDPKSCQVCTCNNGSLTCALNICPILSCPERLRIVPKGSCCPICSRSRDQSAYGYRQQKTCIFQDKSYFPASTYNDDVCPKNNCTCTSDFRTRCTISNPCPALDCDASDQTYESGQCCPKCRHVGPSLKAFRPPPSICSNKGLRNGHTWELNGGCVKCTCIDGQHKCRKKVCPSIKYCPPGEKLIKKPRSCCSECAPNEEGVCTVFGDPHYKTFDGRIFNFQGSCKYLLAKDCGSGNSSFSIRITNDARNSLAFSWTRTITVRLGDIKVSLLQRMRVKINGKRVALPYIKLGSLSVMKDGYRVILRTNEGVRLLWDGVSFVEVTMPSKFRNQLCGLCGNFNGDRRDDFYSKNGRKKYRDGQEFGDSMRVGGLRACSILPRDMPKAYEPTCSQSWESKIKSDRNCNAFRSSLFEKCRGFVSPDYYFNACKLDMCECPGNQCHCEVLSAYARECERVGILVHHWRDYTGCKNVTSFSYTHGSNQVVIPSTETNSAALSLVPISPYSSSSIDLGLIKPGCTVQNSQFCNDSSSSSKVPSNQKSKLPLKKKRRQKMRRKDKKKRQKRLKQQRKRKNKNKKKKKRKKNKKMAKILRKLIKNKKRKSRILKYPNSGLVISEFRDGKETRRKLSWISSTRNGNSGGKKSPPPFQSLLKEESRGNDEEDEEEFIGLTSHSHSPSSSSSSNKDYFQKTSALLRNNKKRIPLPLKHDDNDQDVILGPSPSFPVRHSIRKRNWKRRRRSS